MRYRDVLLGAVVAGAVLGPSLWSPPAVRPRTDPRPADAVAHAQGTGPPGNDEDPTAPPEVAIPGRYLPRPVTDSDATAVTPVATVYFTPQDTNGTTTVLFLYNTSSATATIHLETYRLSGTAYIDTLVAVPPGELVLICGDTVDTSAVSWSDAVLVNFMDSSAYAKMTLPAGVKAEGYVASNGAVSYDPSQAVPTLPLRFSADPATVFLPLVERE